MTSQSFGDRAYAALTRSSDPAGANIAFILASVGMTGWPHIALLSRGEIGVIAPDLLRIALHAGSQTTANLIKAGRATLFVAEAGTVVTVELCTELDGSVEIAGRRLNVFDAQMTQSREHSVPYATVVSGITFKLHEPRLTTARWMETQEALMRRPCV